MTATNGVNVVTIGGGTGSFMLLQGLKRYTSTLTAIVNMVDNGGSTGKLRDEFGTLPSGDVRQCLVALSESDKVRDLFNYRFEGKSELGGHSFGNLFLSALEQVTGSFSDAIETAGEVLNIQGGVVPVTLSNVNLTYTTKDGKTVVGEHDIGDSDMLMDDHLPEIGFDNRALLNPRARTAMLAADMIVVAPGTLYGSLGPSLMVEGIKEALMHSKAKVVYVANLTSDPETNDYTIKKIYSELVRFAGIDFIDYIVINNTGIKQKVLKKYNNQNQSVLELGAFEANKPQLKMQDLLSTEAQDQDLIRHDSDKVARALMKIHFS